jgi:hypothetical protein
MAGRQADVLWQVWHTVEKEPPTCFGFVVPAKFDW